MSKTAQAIIGAIGIGVVGFVMSVAWGYRTGMDMDRGTYLFLATMFGALTLFGIVLHFIM